MKATEIIRAVLDIIDAAEQVEQPAATVTIQRVAGEVDSSEYQNSPQETVAPTAAAFPAGDDVHKSKNPADIRTNAPSMYPGFQAGMK